MKIEGSSNGDIAKMLDAAGCKLDERSLAKRRTLDAALAPFIESMAKLTPEQRNTISRLGINSASIPVDGTGDYPISALKVEFTPAGGYEISAHFTYAGTHDAEDPGDVMLYSARSSGPNVPNLTDAELKQIGARAEALFNEVCARVAQAVEKLDRFHRD